MAVFEHRVHGRAFSVHFTFLDLQGWQADDTLCLAADRRSFITSIAVGLMQIVVSRKN